MGKTITFEVMASDAIDSFLPTRILPQRSWRRHPGKRRRVETRFALRDIARGRGDHDHSAIEQADSPGR